MTEVDKNYPSGVLTVDETPAQRVADYRAKVQEYRDMLDKTDSAFGKDVVGAKRLAAKAEAATMRNRSWPTSTRRRPTSRRRSNRC